VGRRQRRRARGGDSPEASLAGPATDYTDPEGNVLTLRERLSDGTLRQLESAGARAAATSEDVWQRREELLFERLVTGWTIAGLPLTGQRELVGRYRMADADTRAWVRRTIDEHLREHQPEALG
jgi:hypothetical protein